MLIMLIMLIKKVAQSCGLGNKAEFIYWPIGNMNHSKNLTLLTISRFYGRQLDYKRGWGPRVVVSTTAFYARVGVRFPFSEIWQKKNLSKTQYCG